MDEPFLLEASNYNINHRIYYSISDGKSLLFYWLIFSNDLVTELCQKWAFECLSVAHRINRKSPVKY